MTFPEDVIKDAWELVEGRCECNKTIHNHAEGRCNKRLTFEKRGQIGWVDGKHAPWMATRNILAFPIARYFAGIAVRDNIQAHHSKVHVKHFAVNVRAYDLTINIKDFQVFLIRTFHSGSKFSYHFLNC